jgi:diguanylate cyclase (GGDEF)-like protein/PAS domain S-box-containing protein
LALTVIFALVGGLSVLSYARYQQEATTTANNLTEIIRVGIEQTLGRSDGDIRSFAKFLQEEDLSPRLSAQRRNEIEQLMGNHLPLFPQITNYRVFNRDGVSIASAGKNTAAINVKDREWFRSLKNDPKMDLVISDVLIGKGMNRPSIILAVPVRATDGHFLGAVNAALDLLQIQKLINAPEIGAKGMIGVRRTDTARLVLRRPEIAAQINEPVRMEIIPRVERGEQAGVVEFTFPTDHVKHITAFQRMQNYPLVVYVGLAPDDFLRPWKIQTAVALSGTLGLEILLLLLYFRQQRISASLDVERVEATRQSQRYEALAKAAAEGIYGVDANGRLSFLNSAARRMLHLDQDEGVGAHYRSVIYRQPEGTDTAAASDPVLKVLTGSSDDAALPVYHFVDVYRCQDGSSFPVEFSVARIGAPGQLDGAVVTFRDISERKHAEAQAERERLRLQTILRTASDSIHILDQDGLLVEANDAFLNMLGYDRSVIGSLHVSAWDWNNVNDQIHRLIVSRQQEIFVTQHHRRDGVVLDVEINASGIEIDGKGYLYAASRDISQRKQAEQQLRIAATAFEATEGMFVTDAKHVILRVNHAFSEITGYSSEEAVGQTPRLLSSNRHDAHFFESMMQSIEQRGNWHGEIWNRRKNGEVFPEWLTITAVKNEQGSIENYVATLSDISARKAAEVEIRNLAFYDPLTGLPNRRLLLDRLVQAVAACVRHHRQGALLFIDLDNFKTLNDTLGHDKGDLLLQQVAQRLVGCIREDDTVARLGGDEFVVMLEDLDASPAEAANQAQIVAEKILLSLGQAYMLGQHEHHSSASIGITPLADHDVTIEDLLKRADLAMYQAKAAGRNTLRFFDPAMQAAVSARAALEAGLREALAQNQFVLYYQPQVNASGQIIAAEALIRWQHPLRGLVPPGEFIPVAESTGLILPLGQWVLETACAQLHEWAQRPEMTELKLAVNVSVHQFTQRDFVEQVLQTLLHSGAPPTRLKLELTESVLVTNVEDIIEKMTQLKAHGVSFSLDDFGMGYSSLSYLKRLPMDQLKIDQEFVRDMLVDSNDAAIAKMVIALGDSLSLEVIAEGVESEEQRDFLASHGCHTYQGYLFSPPVALAEFVRGCRSASWRTP